MKARTVRKNCFGKSRRKNNHNKYTSIKNQRTKVDNNNKSINNSIVSAYENHRHFIVGPSNVGKTYYILNILEKKGQKRPFYILTISPIVIQFIKTGNEIKPKKTYNGSVVIFDEMLGTRNNCLIDEFFTRWRHEKISVYYISQSYFKLPRQSIGNNSGRIILFKQTLRYVHSMYCDIGANHMLYSEFKEMCRKA